MHSGGIDQMSGETEMSDIARNQRNQSTDSVGSSIRSTIVAVNDTVLDNVVSRFSFVNDHKVRGNWRYILSFFLVSCPIVVFVVMMWFQSYQQCIGRTMAVGPFGEGQTSSINPTLNSLNIFYCGAYKEITLVTKKYDDLFYDYDDILDDTYDDKDPYIANQSQVEYFLCNLEEPYDKYGVFRVPQCRMFKKFYTINGQRFDESTTSCFSSKLSNSDVFVNYSECIPYSTALINSIQYALYATLLVIYIYLEVRIVKKSGCTGLLSYDKWLSTLKNDKHDEKLNEPRLTV